MDLSGLDASRRVGRLVLARVLQRSSRRLRSDYCRSQNGITRARDSIRRFLGVAEGMVARRCSGKAPCLLAKTIGWRAARFGIADRSPASGVANISWRM